MVFPTILRLWRSKNNLKVSTVSVHHTWTSNRLRKFEAFVCPEILPASSVFLGSPRMFDKTNWNTLHDILLTLCVFSVCTKLSCSFDKRMNHSQSVVAYEWWLPEKYSSSKPSINLLKHVCSSSVWRSAPSIALLPFLAIYSNWIWLSYIKKWIMSLK